MNRSWLDGTNFHLACEFIDEQMAKQSWWPKEQPQLAREEFLRMKGSPETLNAWCKKWLYAGQIRQLAHYLKQRDRSDSPIRRR